MGCGSAILWLETTGHGDFLVWQHFGDQVAETRLRGITSTKIEQCPHLEPEVQFYARRGGGRRFKAPAAFADRAVPEAGDLRRSHSLLYQPGRTIRN